MALHFLENDLICYLRASLTAYSHSVRDSMTVFMGEGKVCSHIRTQAKCERLLNKRQGPADQTNPQFSKITMLGLYFLHAMLE